MTIRDVQLDVAAKPMVSLPRSAYTPGQKYTSEDGREYITDAHGSVRRLIPDQPGEVTFRRSRGNWKAERKRVKRAWAQQRRGVSNGG